MIFNEAGSRAGSGEKWENKTLPTQIGSGGGGTGTGTHGFHQWDAASAVAEGGGRKGGGGGTETVNGPWMH